MDSQTTTKFTHLGEADKLYLKAGTYLITDPCYVLDDRTAGDMLWDRLCDEVFQNKETGEQNQSGTIIIEINGVSHKIWWGCTKYGDGGYTVMHNHFPAGEFGVDAGLFAIFPIAFIKAFKPEMEKTVPGIQVLLEMEGGLVEYSDGNMDCGMVFVTTDGTDQEEEEEEDDWREEDEDEEEEE